MRCVLRLTNSGKTGLGRVSESMRMSLGSDPVRAVCRCVWGGGRPVLALPLSPAVECQEGRAFVCAFAHCALDRVL